MPELNIQKVPATDDRTLPIFSEFDQEERSAGDEETKLRWSEFRSHDIFRRVELPAPMDVNKISANFKNGLLEIVAPKDKSAAESATPPDASE